MLRASIFQKNILSKSDKSEFAENFQNCLVEIDEERNLEGSGKESLISKESSRVKVYVIPTNEELVIARETLELIK